ncbi:hypothetical protein IV38_GL001371 [Lactobacillus selangorensis]|uniref:Integral membrane protein n=1 Tax=Lactobacillus selangorensis TaxID=81857 RepID=A0A0R2FU30_9LACO|nr:DUF1700 domain-containing protein [Lactobacillus selangorensis]KRN28372.1 hypothetical protein IV38_GL001371 [Lactobacillus selangorensis]KRN31873.1 hypothetical protein IV40_GL001158 [Lactobacillus selangorensis]
MNNYLQQLEKHLTGLSPAEKDDVLEFYREYILDAGLDSEAEITQKLGRPKQLARKILADYSIKADDGADTWMDQPQQKSRHNLRLMWIILLALFATPIAIPIALVVFGLIFIGILLIGILAVVALILLATAIIGGFAALAVGFSVLFTHFATALFFIGIGLIALGSTFLILIIAKYLLSLFVQMLTNFTKFVYNKIQKRRQAKEAR